MDQYLHNTLLLSFSIQSSFYYKSNSPNHTHIHTVLLYIPKHFLSNIHMQMDALGANLSSVACLKMLQHMDRRNQGGTKD